MEEWKIIPNCSNYSVSNKGRIKCQRTGADGKVLAFPLTDTDPYITIPLMNDEGKRIFYRVHRLVAEMFIGAIPKGYHVHHKNGIKTDNRVENLEIISPKEHHKESELLGQATVEGLNKYNKYEKPRKVAQYTKDGQLLAIYCNSKFASTCTGVCSRNILQVASGEQNRKQAGGYIWKFVDEKGVI